MEAVSLSAIKESRYLRVKMFHPFCDDNGYFADTLQSELERVHEDRR